MDKFLGKLSLYDMIVMVIPGGTILLFFLDYYGVDLLSIGSDISPLVVLGAVVASYIIGMGNHVIAKKLWKTLRDNYWLLSYCLKNAKNVYTTELNKLTENIETDRDEIELLLKTKLRDKYYEAYSYVLERSHYDGISIIESQVAFLQSMVIPGLLMLIYLSKHDSRPLLLGGILLFLLLFYLIFDRTMLIHRQVWEYYEYTKRIKEAKQ